MADPRRVEFVTRHFTDLQSIRWAPVPAIMILLSAARKPLPGRGNVWVLLLGLLIAIAPFYWWSNAAIRRRYGSVRASEEERRRMQRHPVILALLGGLALAIILAKFGALGSDAHTSDFWVPAAVLIAILTTILDTTNLPSRRIVWGIGLGALLGAGPVLIEVAQGAAVFALIGAVWLSVSIFDFLLLRRIFAEISAAQPAATGEAAESHG